MYKKLLAAAGTAGAAISAWTTVALAVVEPVTGGLPGSVTNLGNVGANADLGSGATNLPALVGNIISVVLGFLGIVFIILIVYAGIKWMMAQGEAEKTKEATRMIQQAVVGLVIVVAAYAISNYVIGALLTATT